MIKLLLVDDEILSREGIIERLPWKDIGIGLVEQADDGINALEKMSQFQPDIVLTDVRMPRMDGITLAFKVRESYANCKIIFMSGYSDKEYLKSAIQLSAISYVEKPIDLDELQAAVEKSISLILEERSRKSREIEIKQKLTTSIPVIKNDMALKLIRKNTSHKLVLDRLKIVNPYIKQDSDFITLIIKLDDVEEVDSTKLEYNQQEICDYAESILIKQGFNVLAGIKDDFHIVIHICLDPMDDCQNGKKPCIDLAEELNEKWKTFISVGVRISGMGNVYQSYNTAVIALQKRFYHSMDTIIFYNEDPAKNYEVDEIDSNTFTQYLIDENKNQCNVFMKALASNFRRNDNTPVDYVKDCYYRLLKQLLTVAQMKGVSLFEKDTDTDFIKEFITALAYLDDIEKFIADKMDLFFDLVFERGKTSVIISDILKFIHDNYHDRSLGLDLISEQFLITPSYICVIFKDEIGKTVNQYITEFRIEKAKKLLENSRLKVQNIAESVGYSNGNYFIKAFRKMTGLTPKEYREKGLS